MVCTTLRSIQKLSAFLLTFLTTLLIFMFLLTVEAVFSQTTRSVQDGNWNAATTWSNGVPAATTGTLASPVRVGNEITLNQNLTLSTGVFYFGYNGTSTTGKPVKDVAAGTHYSLTMEKNGAYNAGQGVLDIKSGVTNFEGGATINNTTLIVRSGAKLILGPLKCAVCDPDDAQYDEAECAKPAYNDCRESRLNIGIGTRITVEPNAELIVYGNVINTNNTGTLNVNGLVYIVGTYTSDRGNIEVVQEVEGEGDIITTGSMTTKGASTIFGSKIDCTTGPCSGLALGCVIKSTIDLQGIITACLTDGQPVNTTITGMVTRENGDVVPYEYVWQQSQTSGTNGWTNIGSPVTQNTVQAHTYNATTSATTWYRLAATKNLGGSNGSCTSFSIPVEIRPVADGWTGAIDNLWSKPGNWCGNALPTLHKDVIIPVGAHVNIDAANNFQANARNLTISEGASLSLIDNTSVLNLYGNLSNNGTFSGAQGTVSFRYNASDAANTTHTTLDGLGSFTFNHITVPETGKSLTFPEGDVTVTGNLTFANNANVNPAATGKIILTGGNPQSVDGSSNTVALNLRNVLVDKTSGSIAFNTAVALRGALDFTTHAATTLTFNQNFTLTSVDDNTRNDARIGMVPSTVNFTYGASGAIVAERFMNALSGKKYRYIAPAVASTEAPSSNIGSTIQFFNNGWKSHAKTSPLALGTGYTVLDYGVNATWTVRGQVKNGSHTWAWTSASPAGWYLLGNPYPAAIRWSNAATAWEMTNIATTIAVTVNSISGHPNYFRYYSFVAENNPDSWGSGELEGQGIVARGQAFWVYKGAGAATLTVHQGAKADDQNGKFYRQKTSAPADQLVAILNNGRFSDHAVLSLQTEGQDMPKLWNREMDIYLAQNGEHLTMKTLQSLPNDVRIPLGIQVTEPGNYTLSFANVDKFSGNAGLYLIDKQAGTATPITETVTVTINTMNAVEDRFYLAYNAEVPKQTLAERISVYPNPVVDRLTVALAENQPARIQVLDSRGGVLLTEVIEGATTFDFSGYIRGMYIVRIFTGTETVVHKIVKQ